MLGRPHGVGVVDLVDLVDVDVDDVNKDDIVIVDVDEDDIVIVDLEKYDIVIVTLTGQSCVLGRPDWSGLSRRETSKDVPLRHRSAERAT